MATKAAKAAPAPVKEKSQTELIAALATASGLTQAQTKTVVEAHAALLLSELNTAGSVLLPGLGKLKVGLRPERQGRNPSTGESITIKASKTVKFTAAKKLKEGLQSTFPDSPQLPFTVRTSQAAALGISPSTLYALCAGLCRVERAMRPYLEALL